MNRDPRGYYAALHVTPDATAAEIQHAFRALMRRRHPDVEAAVGNEAAAGNGAVNNDGDDARRILESFAVLRDPISRAEY
ncbi:MAG TPA: DnaJ domain-containing protein, partial [Arthrobacter sp.]|nr:DnaJ domain-containing protein [Arthrobacter sp.]